MEVVRREPYGDSPRVGHRGATTQRAILDAALEVFREHGFHETRVELITDVAGCSRPAFYQYFSSKDDVFWQLAGALADRLGDVAASIEPNTPDPCGLAAIERWLDVLIDVLIEFEPVVDSFPTAFREPTQQFTRVPGVGNALGPAIIASAPDTDRFGGIPAISSVASIVAMRTIHHWHHETTIARPELVAALAGTLHRLLHGPIEGVNLPPRSVGPPNEPSVLPTFTATVDVVEPARPRGRATRDRLLAAAIAVLSRRGYHESRVDDIVAAADVSHGSFYRYFASKEELFRVVAERAFRELSALMSAFPAADELDRLGAWLDRCFGFYDATGGIITTWQEVDLDDPALREYALEVSVTVREQLARILHERGFGPSMIDALSVVSIAEYLPYTVVTLGTIERDAVSAAAEHFVRVAVYGQESAAVGI